MIQKEFVIYRENAKSILADLTFNELKERTKIIIFCHGYKGYKDWGAWNIFSKQLVNEGFCVLKFNFSHNGGTIDNPIDFPDLEAFGQNNYQKELDDLGDVIDWVCSNNDFSKYLDATNITLMGHSRGGGVAILKASEDNRIKKLVTLAAVSDFKSRFPKGSDLSEWEKNGVRYILNGRTKQKMPHYYQFYTNFLENEARLDVNKAEANLLIPHVIFHGDNDEAVAVEEAYRLKELNPNAELKILKGVNHTFGSSHPYLNENLPKDLMKCLEF